MVLSSITVTVLWMLWLLEAVTSTEYVSLMVSSSITVMVLWMLWLLKAATSTEYVSLMVLSSITMYRLLLWTFRKVGFVVDKRTLREVVFRVVELSAVNTAPLMFHTLIFIIAVPVHKKSSWRNLVSFQTKSGNRVQYKERSVLLFFIVVPCCMLFQYLLYCSNSCTSLHFKTIKSHTKTLKILPYMFRSPLKPSSGGPWLYFAVLLNWNVDLHLL